jgi:hypothetical protein
MFRVKLRPGTVILIDFVIIVRVSAATDFARAVVLGRRRLVVVGSAVCATACRHRGGGGGGALTAAFPGGRCLVTVTHDENRWLYHVLRERKRLSATPDALKTHGNGKCHMMKGALNEKHTHRCRKSP